MTSCGHAEPTRLPGQASLETSRTQVDSVPEGAVGAFPGRCRSPPGALRHDGAPGGAPATLQGTRPPSARPAAVERARDTTPTLTSLSDRAVARESQSHGPHSPPGVNCGNIPASARITAGDGAGV